MCYRRAFTKFELLVVLTIFGLLTVILLPQLGKSKEHSGPVCGTNLKAQGTSFAIYANQSSDKLPCFPGAPGGPALHDQPKQIIDALVLANTPVGTATLNNIPYTDGAKRRFYCPSMYLTSSSLDKAWDHADGTPDPTFRSLGYAYLNDRTGKAFASVPDGPLNKGGTVPNITLPGRSDPALVYHKNYSAEENPSVSELAFDEILTPTAKPTHFTDIVSGNIPGETTPHIKGNMPSGQNILHFDNHVDWRPFNPAAAVTIGPVAVSKGEVFWWLANP